MRKNTQTSLLLDERINTSGRTKIQNQNGRNKENRKNSLIGESNDRRKGKTEKSSKQWHGVMENQRKIREKKERKGKEMKKRKEKIQRLNTVIHYT